MSNNFLTFTTEELTNLNLPRYAGEKFDSFIIIPTEELHDSGWKTMKIVCCEKDNPVSYFYSGSDVIHLDGVGGYGDVNWERRLKNNTGPLSAWRIDCLPCGFLRVVCNRTIVIEKYSCSDLQVYCSEV